MTEKRILRGCLKYRDFRKVVDREWVDDAAALLFCQNCVRIHVVGASQGGQRPNYLGNVAGCSPADVTTGNIDRLIKTSCFAFPDPGVLGNLGRDLFHMPLFRNLDFSVFKNQNLWGEELKMQFRAEMFNILNNTNLVAQTFTNTFNGSGALISSLGTPTAPTANQARQIQLGLRLLF